MAVLNGYTDNPALADTMELTPITPSLDGPRDAYEVKFRRGKEVIFESRYNVHEWQLGHFYISDTARIFQRISNIIDAKLNISAALVDQEKYKEPASLEIGIDWLVIVLLGETSNRKKRHGSREILIDAFTEIAKPDQSSTGHVGYFMRFNFLCTPEAAKQFGDRLAEECQAAKDLRWELGIPAREETDYLKYLPDRT